VGDIATPLPLPVGGQEVVPTALIAKLREHREVLGPKWVDMLIGMIEERDAFGRKKYGQSLHTFDGRSPHLDALQELVDLFQYLHKAEMQHAQLLAENAGLRAKVAMLEGRAERAEARAEEAERALRGAPVALPPDVPDADEEDAAPADPDESPCSRISAADCARRVGCNGCPAYTPPRWGTRA
jgi:hypothetical protein